MTPARGERHGDLVVAAQRRKLIVENAGQLRVIKKRSAHVLACKNRRMRMTPAATREKLINEVALARKAIISGGIVCYNRYK